MADNDRETTVLIALYAPVALVLVLLNALALRGDERVHELMLFLRGVEKEAPVAGGAPAPAAAAAPEASAASASAPAPAPAGDFLPRSGGTISGDLNVTGALDARTLSVDGAAVSSFVVELVNINGVLHHGLYNSFGGAGSVSGTGTFGKLTKLKYGRFATKTGAFVSGGAIDPQAGAQFVLDSAPQTAGGTIGFATIVFNDTGTPLAAELGMSSAAIDGASRLRPMIVLRNADSAADFPIDSIPPGKRVAVRVFGFFR